MSKTRSLMNRNAHIAYQTTGITIMVNILLSVFKFIAGILAGSHAMLSDAVHSASDVFSSFVVIIGIKAANKASDHTHPYGHERMECVAAILLAAVLCVTGAMIGYAGITKIIKGSYDAIAIPGLLALLAAVISILVKESMYWFTRAVAKKIHSSAMLADAWHHRSDALSSIGSFAGILAARLGLPVFDPIASVLICLLIIKASLDIFLDAVSKMTDKACDDAVIEKMRRIISEQEGVFCIDQLKTRIFGDKIYVDIEIQADGEQTLHQSHAIAQQVHDEIEGSFQNVKHCMVHVNPVENTIQIEE